MKFVILYLEGWSKMTKFMDDFNHGIPLKLPPAKEYDKSVDHAPKRPAVLNLSLIHI